MYILIFALLAMVIAALVFVSQTQTRVAQQGLTQASDQIHQIAVQGAQVFSACAAQQPGVYDIASLESSGALPGNFPSTTPLGNAWVCQVSTGGVNGGNVALVLWASAPTNNGNLGSGSMNNTALEQQVAWNAASLLVQQMQGVKNVDVLMLPANSTKGTSAVNGLQYDLTGMVSSASYGTPVIAQGLASNTTK